MSLNRILERSVETLRLILLVPGARVTLWGEDSSRQAAPSIGSCSKPLPVLAVKGGSG
jgi:hypothetical protein